MPKMGEFSDEVRQNMAEDFYNWLGDYTVLRTLVQQYEDITYYQCPSDMSTCPFVCVVKLAAGNPAVKPT